MPKPKLYLLLLMLAVVPPFAAAANVIVPAPASAPATAAAGSFVGSFSPDGRFFLFFSHANNLVTNDGTAPSLDLFARDLSNGVTTLVSVGAHGRGGGNDHSPSATMSTNGLVAFESRASNLATNDTNGLSDVFVRNLPAGTTTLVSVNSNGTSGALGVSLAPLISHDGRRIIFESTASNVVAGDTNLHADVFVRDLPARTTALVSRNATNAGFAPGPSESASISADGRYVAFVKRATNNVAGNRRSEGEIYVRDIEAGTTTWASTNAATNFLQTIGYPYRCYNPVLSSDGRYVAFLAEGTPAPPLPSFADRLLLRHDLVTGVTETLALSVTNAYGIPMSADGRVLAWISTFGSGITLTGLYLRDDDAGTNILLSLGRYSATAPVLSADGSRVAWFAYDTLPTFLGLRVFDRTSRTSRLVNLSTNGASVLPTEASTPAISPDGRLVAFETEDARLVANDENSASDLFVRDLETNTTHLVSAALPELPPASGSGMATLAPGALSADGRRVAFTALDGNLVPGDTNRLADVFVRDLLTGELVAASARPVPVPGGGTTLLFQTNEISSAPVISGNGQVVVYRGWRPWASAAALYWRDLAGQEPVAVLPNGTLSVSNAVSPSHDGNLLVFDSDQPPGALGLAQSEFNNGTDVYLRDVAAGTNALVSVNRDGTGTGNGVSIQPRLSPDGQWIAFLSRATDLTTNVPPPGFYNVFARHLPTAQTRLVSTHMPSGVSLQCSNLAFSLDSRYLVFAGRAFSAFTNVYRHNLLTGTTALVCGGCLGPSVNRDGRWVAYVNQGRAGQFGFPTWQVMVKDMATDFESLMSVWTNNLAPAPALQSFFDLPPSAQVTPDGRYVLFFSRAVDVASTDTNRQADLFARDRVARRTYHLTVNLAGTAGAAGLSSVLQIASDSRTAIIQSHADDLAPGDYNFRRDIFVLRLAEPDSDGDGMDDDWEMTYFSTVDRDGTGDFDGDGASDRHEFGAQTDPTNTGSIFRVISLEQAGGSYRLYWATEAGAKYQVQSRDRDARVDGWANLGAAYTATSATGSQAVHYSVGFGTNRFYRVVRLE